MLPLTIPESRRYTCVYFRVAAKKEIRNANGAFENSTGYTSRKKLIFRRDIPSTLGDAFRNIFNDDNGFHSTDETSNAKECVAQTEKKKRYRKERPPFVCGI